MWKITVRCPVLVLSFLIAVLVSYCALIGPVWVAVQPLAAQVQHQIGVAVRWVP